MEEEIMNTVESLFGKDVKIVDCQTSSSVQQEEVLLINGIPIKMDGISDDDAKAIKCALLDGQMPAVEHLNQLLLRAGLCQQPVEVETSLTVKSSLTTTEEVLVSRNGHVLDERTIETKEHFNHQSNQKEVWQPIKPNKLGRNTPAKLCETVSGSKLQNNSNATFALGRDATSSELAASCSGNSFGLNHTWSNASGTTASIISSSSAFTDSDQVIDSMSNMSTAPTIGDYSVKSSNYSSCDSGHDGLFHSSSLTAQNYKKEAQTDSLYCDFASSSDEIDLDTAVPLSTYLPKATEHHSHTTAADLGSNISNILLKLLYSENTNTIKTVDIILTCILCARLHQHPHEFLDKLQQNLLSKNTSKDAEIVLQLLENWLETCTNDFHDQKFIDLVQILLKNCEKMSTELAKRCDKLMRDINEKLNNFVLKPNEFLLKQSSSSSSLGRQSSIKSLKRFASNACKTNSIMSVAGNEPKELAHQLTAIEHAYLRHLRPEEFLQMLQQSTEQQSETQINFESVDLPNNIKLYSAWYNRLSYLAATEIVKLNKKSQRQQMIDFWIDAGMECSNIGNFNSLMAIITGLNLTAVSRLKKTWLKVDTSKLDGLKLQMDPSSNFNSYRSIMKAAIWRSERQTANEQERAIIPYFNLLLQDLYSINEGPDTVDKCLQIGHIMSDFVKWQHITCPYEKLSKVSSYLQCADVYAELALMKASYACEPPENADEKEHYKTIKAEKKLPKNQLT